MNLLKDGLESVGTLTLSSLLLASCLEHLNAKFKALSLVKLLPYKPRPYLVCPKLSVLCLEHSLPRPDLEKVISVGHELRIFRFLCALLSVSLHLQRFRVCSLRVVVSIERSCYIEVNPSALKMG